MDKKYFIELMHNHIDSVFEEIDEADQYWTSPYKEKLYNNVLSFNNPDPKEYDYIISKNEISKLIQFLDNQISIFKSKFISDWKDFVQNPVEECYYLDDQCDYIVNNITEEGLLEALCIEFYCKEGVTVLENDLTFDNLKRLDHIFDNYFSKKFGTKEKRKKILNDCINTALLRYEYDEKNPYQNKRLKTCCDTVRLLHVVDKTENGSSNIIPNFVSSCIKQFSRHIYVTPIETVFLLDFLFNNLPKEEIFSDNMLLETINAFKKESDKEMLLSLFQKYEKDFKRGYGPEIN